MNSKKFTFIVLLIISFAFLYRYSDLNSMFDKAETPLNSWIYETKLSSFVWDSPTDLDQPQVDEFISFAKKENISTLYVSIDEYVDIYELAQDDRKQEALLKFEDNLTKLVSIANAKDIRVIALVGHPEWSRSSHWYIPHLLLDYVKDFNERTTEDKKLHGILFDIEFYNLESFESNKNQHMTEYLTLVNQIMEEEARDEHKNLEIGFTIPSWFDRKEVVPEIMYQDKYKLLAFHLFDLLNKYPNSFVFVMNYRNFSRGENGSINLIKDEFDYLENNDLNLKVVIGQETAKVDEENVTFYGLGKNHFYKEAGFLHKYYKDHPNYRGIGIHQLDSYMEIE